MKCENFFFSFFSTKLNICHLHTFHNTNTWKCENENWFNLQNSCETWTPSWKNTIRNQSLMRKILLEKIKTKLKSNSYYYHDNVYSYCLNSIQYYDESQKLPLKSPSLITISITMTKILITDITIRNYKIPPHIQKQ
jgi:hypothetical protein